MTVLVEERPFEGGKNDVFDLPHSAERAESGECIQKQRNECKKNETKGKSARVEPW